ncbi:sensor domain-containing diguanylate cyclase [Mangrovactinospora gilvigrisea]|uniref:Sensor domain-containing diguanylate cyclase n=1 Tax=Mangrovactinospora gilvigrisea TaxID=1428644 RepID=A0A1J7BEI3_9ACTN|nr:sensor domain-containing diguanylate cyclase [Mangrovactinospora gilvigrisea]
MRALHGAVANLNVHRPLPDTLQAVAEGVVAGTDYQLAACHLVRPGGDLMVAAVAGTEDLRDSYLGTSAPRAAWEQMLAGAERLGSLRFIPQERGGRFLGNGVPRWTNPGITVSSDPTEWQPGDVLMVPMHTASRELLGVITVDRPRSGRRPGAWVRESMELYALHAAIALTNANLRLGMQRAMARLEREQKALRASEESFRQAFEYAPSGMAMTELYPGERIGKLLRANDALCRMLGRSATALRRFAFSDLVHPEDLQTLLDAPPGGGLAEVRLSRRDGTYIWVCLRNSVLVDTGEGPHYLLTHVEDIDERRREEEALVHRASHDSLTGLPNAAELRARLERMLPQLPHLSPLSLGGAVPSGNDRSVAVIFCDLDGFKPINDRYGHHAGDAVLVEVARRLQQAVRVGDTVARLGGDEFVVLADHVVEEEAADLAARLEQAVTAPILLEGATGVSVRVGVSFGIGWAAAGMTADQLLQTADQRMYRQKRGRARSRRG